MDQPGQPSYAQAQHASQHRMIPHQQQSGNLRIHSQSPAAAVPAALRSDVDELPPRIAMLVPEAKLYSQVPPRAQRCSSCCACAVVVCSFGGC